VLKLINTDRSEGCDNSETGTFLRTMRCSLQRTPMTAIEGEADVSCMSRNRRE